MSPQKGKHVPGSRRLQPLTAAQRDLAERSYPYLRGLAGRIARTTREYQDLLSYLHVELVNVCSKWNPNAERVSTPMFVRRGLGWAVWRYFSRGQRPDEPFEPVDTPNGDPTPEDEICFRDFLARLEPIEQSLLKAVVEQGGHTLGLAKRLGVTRYEANALWVKVREKLREYRRLGYGDTPDQ